MTEKIPSFNMFESVDPSYRDRVSRVEFDLHGMPVGRFETDTTELFLSPGTIELTQYAHPDHANFQPIAFDASDPALPPDGEFAPRRGNTPAQPQERLYHPSNGPKRVRSEEQMLAELDRIDQLFKGM